MPADAEGLALYAKHAMLARSRMWFAWGSHYPTIEIRLLEGTRCSSRVKAWIAMWQLIYKRYLNRELSPPENVQKVVSASANIDELFEQVIQDVRPPLMLRRWMRQTYEACKDSSLIDFPSD